MWNNHRVGDTERLLESISVRFFHAREGLYILVKVEEISCKEDLHDDYMIVFLCEEQYERGCISCIAVVKLGFGQYIAGKNYQYKSRVA